MATVEYAQSPLSNVATPDVIYANMARHVQVLERQVETSHRRLKDLCVGSATLESAARAYQCALRNRERGRDRLKTAKMYKCDAEFHGKYDTPVGRALLREITGAMRELQEQFFNEME
jgi:hypothetical protein